MKHLFSIFSMLVLVALSVGCSDNETEDAVRRIYPTEKQTPVEISNVKGRLSYDEVNKKWTINSLDFPLASGDEEGAELYIENPKNDMSIYEGDIKYSGYATLLYTEVTQHSYGLSNLLHCYSINLSEIESINYAVATKNVCINTSPWSTGEYILEITNGDMTQKRKIWIE